MVIICNVSFSVPENILFNTRLESPTCIVCSVIEIERSEIEEIERKKNGKATTTTMPRYKSTGEKIPKAKVLPSFVAYLILKFSICNPFYQWNILFFYMLLQFLSSHLLCTDTAQTIIIFIGIVYAAREREPEKERQRETTLLNLLEWIFGSVLHIYKFNLFALLLSYVACKFYEF